MFLNLKVPELFFVQRHVTMFGLFGHTLLMAQNMITFAVSMDG